MEVAEGTKQEVIRVSKQGIFTISKFYEVYESHDLKKDYHIFDALRNRIDD